MYIYMYTTIYLICHVHHKSAHRRVYDYQFINPATLNLASGFSAPRASDSERKTLHIVAEQAMKIGEAL